MLKYLKKEINMITSLKLDNFKSWDDLYMPMASLTGLFGANSSGKTSVLQLLLMLKQTAESNDRSLPLNLGDSKSYVSLGTMHDILRGPQTEKTQILGYEISWKPEKLAIKNPANESLKTIEELSQFAVLFGMQNNFYVFSTAYSFNNMSFGMERKSKTLNEHKYKLVCSEDSGDFHPTRKRGRVWDLPEPIKCYGFPDQVYSYYQNTDFLRDLDLEFEKLFSRVFYLGPLREYPKRQYTWAGEDPGDMGKRGEGCVNAILSARSKKSLISRGRGKKKISLEELIAEWLKKLGLIHSFKVQKIGKQSNLYRVMVKKNKDSKEVLITDVGFGVSQILPVLALCYYVPKGSTIILEQPEIHLHPTVQAGMADVFIDAIKTRGVQIILESHSEYLLNRIQTRIAENELVPEDAALYFCKMENGSSQLEKLDIDEYGNINNWPEGFFGNQFEEKALRAEAALKKMSEK